MSKTKSEKRFGLTIEEIRELKNFYVKQQDFETAVMWREMERTLLPKSKNDTNQIFPPEGITINSSLTLPDGWSYYKPINQ